MRSGRLSLGPTIDRFEELFAERVGAPYAAAVSSGTAGLHLLCDHGRHRAGRRGDHVAVLVRRLRELLHLRGRRRRSSPTSTRARSTSTRPPSRRRSRRGRRRSSRVDIYGYPCELDELRAIADRHGLALIERLVRGARRRVQGRAARLARRPVRLRVLSEQADDDRRGRMCHDALRGDSGGSCARSATRAAATAGGWLEHVRLGFNYRLDDVAPRSGSASSRGSTRSSRCARAVAERYDELLRGHRRRRAAVPATTPTTCARGSSTSSCCPTTRRASA